jgi:hypothetical protein
MLVRQPEIQRGGRLIMLGTPNYGSVLARDVLDVDQAAGRLFETFGVTTDAATALKAVRTWPSVYELLPSPFFDPEYAAIYENPRPGWSANHLENARHLHQTLDEEPVSELMTCVLGTNVLTIDGDPTATFAGDGVVSNRLGRLEGAQILTVTGDHVSLPANPLVLASVTPLLHAGKTGLLH